MIFYNRCQLLRHAREHTQNNEPMKFASPTIQPISLNSLKPRVTPPNLNTSCAKECTECSMKFATRIGLQEHMQRTNSSTEGLTCEPCGMTLPNRLVFWWVGFGVNQFYLGARTWLIRGSIPKLEIRSVRTAVKTLVTEWPISTNISSFIVSTLRELQAIAVQ